jgi:hypothetical protein
VATVRLDLDLGPGKDAAELEDAAGEAVERVSAGAAPVGSRATDVAALGSFVVTLARAAVGQLLGIRQGRLAHRSGRTAKLRHGADSIEISDGSASHHFQLIEMLLAAHGRE